MVKSSKIVTEAIAREIMGNNLFGVKDAIALGFVPTRAQSTRLTNMRFTIGLLESCKDSHILIAVLPYSILEVRDFATRSKSIVKIFHGQNWYDGDVFAKCPPATVNWILLRKTPILDSGNMTEVEHLSLLMPGERMPTPQIVVYATVCYRLFYSESLFPDMYVRCDAQDVEGRGIYVGYPTEPTHFLNPFFRRCYPTVILEPGLCIGGCAAEYRHLQLQMTSMMV